jgi:hypothetical protein
VTVVCLFMFNEGGRVGRYRPWLLSSYHSTLGPCADEMVSCSAASPLLQLDLSKYSHIAAYIDR